MAVKNGLREVAIVGVGHTPVGYVNKSPELLGMTERELYAWAAMNAMEDAGVGPQDIDAYYVGLSGPNYDAKIKSASAQFGTWIGMNGKPAIFHDEGCATSGFGLEMAITAVASGRYDCVLSGATQVNSCTPKPSHVPFEREPMDSETLWNNVYSAFDPGYEKPGVGGSGVMDALGVTYARNFGLTLDEIDDACANYIWSKRREAYMNKDALIVTETMEDEAARFGFDSVIDYLHSAKYNPFVGATIRSRYLGNVSVDAGSAVIVCSMEMAEKLQATPVRVAGAATATFFTKDWAETPIKADKAMFDQAYAQAGITDPRHEVDYLSIHDCPCLIVPIIAEESGYIEQGKTWEYMRDHRMTFDQDRPINTTGGRSQMGHPRAASFQIEVAEAVRQIRGINGDRQMPTAPKTAVLWAAGTGWNAATIVLQAM